MSKVLTDFNFEEHGEKYLETQHRLLEQEIQQLRGEIQTKEDEFNNIRQARRTQNVSATSISLYT